jgi:dienelactone hydrolase
VLRNARAMPLRVVLFEPTGARRPMPAIVVFQPVNSPPEAGLALILEFVRRGMLAAAIDFRGAAPGENRVLLRENVLGVTALDAAAVLAYLRGRPDIDSERIGVIGHSVGGTLAIRAGVEQPWVRATIAVGIASDVPKNQPQNLLWLVGLYDEFRPLSEMQQVMEASTTEGVAEIDRTAGDFARGTARRLDVTATADHFTEFLNHGAAVRAVEWFESAFEGRPTPRPPVAAAPWFYACHSLAFLFGWLLLVRRLREFVAAHKRLFSVAMAVMLVALVLVPLPRLALFRADLALWGLALLLAVNSGARAGRAAWLAPLGWLSLVLTLVVNQVSYFWRYPYLLYALPAFPFWHATGVLNSYLFIYPRGLLFSSYTGAVLRPGWVFWGLLALEVARPGTALRRLWSLVERAAARPQKAAATAGRSWAAWGAVLALFAGLGAILWMRTAQGFVDRDSLRLAGWVILRFAVLPFFIFALLKRRLLPGFPKEWDADERR